MRFMVMMIPGDKSYERGAVPTAEAVAPMTKYNEELTKAGILLACDGLHPTAKGARIEFDGAGKKKTVKDGPFTEAKEVVGGYWFWQVKSKEEAIEWASRCPADPGDVLEIRQVFEAADFAAAVR
ncbi:YciI family protein [soil metagenome]